MWESRELAVDLMSLEGGHLGGRWEVGGKTTTPTG
jgi:hypothetical protein